MLINCKQCGRKWLVEPSNTGVHRMDRPGCKCGAVLRAGSNLSLENTIQMFGKPVVTDFPLPCVRPQTELASGSSIYVAVVRQGDLRPVAAKGTKYLVRHAHLLEALGGSANEADSGDNSVSCRIAQPELR